MQLPKTPPIPGRGLFVISFELRCIALRRPHVKKLELIILLLQRSTGRLYKSLQFCCCSSVVGKYFSEKWVWKLDPPLSCLVGSSVTSVPVRGGDRVGRPTLSFYLTPKKSVCFYSSERERLDMRYCNYNVIPLKNLIRTRHRVFLNICSESKAYSKSHCPSI